MLQERYAIERWNEIGFEAKKRVFFLPTITDKKQTLIKKILVAFLYPGLLKKIENYW